MSHSTQAMFYGYVFEPTGYGAASRAYIHALYQAGVTLSVVNLGPRRLVSDPLIESLLNRQIDPTFHLCFSDADGVALLKNHFHRLIALTTWETDRLPQKWIDILNGVLEVWVPSRENLAVFQKHLGVPVFQLPYPYLSPLPSNGSVIESRLGLKNEDFVFYSIFTWQDRKNPLGIIDAFLKAFPNETDVALVLKVTWSFANKSTALSQVDRVARNSSQQTSGSLLGELANHARGTDRVKIVGDLWPERWVADLAQRGNCYVSLHRGEGWCCPLFEAACAGTPIIATNHSGPTDYLNPAFHNLVNCTLSNVEQQSTHFAFFNPDMMWAEPDISHAASLMRHVYYNRQVSLERARSGAELLHQKYSLRAVGQSAATRLAALSSVSRPV
jgi:glycosyltransferase involved in cell wall biosynthesis